MNMFNKRDLLIYLTVLLSTIVLAFFWEYVSLPFSEINYTQSFLINKKINPNTDTLRYCLFVGIPLFLYIFLNTFNQSHQINFKLTEKNNYEESNFFDKKVFIIIIFFVIFIIYDCLGSSNNFQTSIPRLDSLHDGDYLTPALNFFETGGLWSSSATVHGGADFIYPILIWKLTGLKTIGSYKTFIPFIILLVKFFSIILSYQVTKITLLEKNTKIVFFTIFSFFLISLSHYNAPMNYSVISYRDVFTILFLIFFIEIFLRNKNLFKLHFAITFIAYISLLFHYDVGVYLYALLILYTFYLIIIKQFKHFFLIYLLTILFWLIFIYIFGIREFFSFIENFFLIVSSMDLAHGLEYPSPFFSIAESKDGMRATRGLLFQIIAGILILKNTIFTKDNLPKNYKILLLFIFFLCLIVYKNALGRSEAYHIRMSTDIQLIIIAFFLLKNFLRTIERKNSHKQINLFIRVVPIVLCLVIFFNNFTNIKNLNNILTSKIKFLDYIKLEDDQFIKTAWSNNVHLTGFLKRFNQLNKKEKCVQNFTADIILPYLLKKPTCTKYFSSWLALSKKAQLKYIEEIKITSPIYIIYESPGFIVDNIRTNKRLKLVDSYIINNYDIYESFNNYTILKKNE